MKYIKKLLPYLKPYWKRSALALVLLIAVILMDLAIPRLIQRIIDDGISANNMQVVISTTLWMLGISIVQALFAIGNNNLSVYIGEAVGRDLREALFLKIQSFSFGNLDRLNTGQLMVRLSSDTAMFQRLTRVFLRIGTRAPILMIGSLILMFQTDSRLALMMLPLLVIIMVVIVFFVSRMGPLFHNMQERLDMLNMTLQENIAGVRLVKAFVRVDHEAERFEQSNDRYTQFSIRVMKFMSTLSPTMSMFVNLAIVVVIYMGGMQSISDSITIGQLVAFINYLYTTLGPLGIMVMLSNALAAGSASSERIIGVLETEPDVQDDPNPLALPEMSHPTIQFEDVSFHYNGSGNEEVLTGINLTAEPGQTVAILGATGAGKSSLISLVPRFYEAASGKILLNGVDIRQLAQQDLLHHIGIVPQETVLFSGTVRDNIRYGRPDASEEDVVAAAQAAQAHDFILSLPKGYDSHVEERGTNLSGGQKQRLAIARALLMRPSILILDDSTSSVDVATETSIQEALKGWMQGRTSFVVAQRISTVLNADKIVVIDEGRITAEGTHQELMQSSPIYQEIYASQLGNGFHLEAMEEDR